MGRRGLLPGREHDRQVLLGRQQRLVEPLNTFVVEIDTDAPTSSIECNSGACQDFYNSTVSVSLEGDDGDGGGIGEIRYTTDGTPPTASSTLYTGAFPVSGNGLKTIRWFAKDNAGNVETPSNTETFTIETRRRQPTAACNGGGCGGFFNEDVNVALTANDAGGAGVNEIYFTTDGSAPNTSSTPYTGPIPVTSTTLVRFRAEDNAGNLEAVKDQQVNIDKDQPNSTIDCNGSACVGGSAYYEDTVSVELGATDSGVSDVKEIRYTTDGSNPTGSSTLYTGAFDVAQTSTVKFRAEDNAGNVESPVNSQEIKIENGPPVSSIQCNGVACQNAYNAPVAATLSATDDASGVDEIRYTTDGSEPNGTSTLYTGAIPVNATTTIKFFATDVAAKVESPAKSQDDRDRQRRPGERDPLQRRRLRRPLQGGHHGHDRGQRHRRRGRQGDPLHDGRLEPDRGQPALHGADPGQRVLDDQVARPGQRRQPRGDQVTGHRLPERRRRQVQEAEEEEQEGNEEVQEVQEEAAAG